MAIGKINGDGIFKIHETSNIAILLIMIISMLIPFVCSETATAHAGSPSKAASSLKVVHTFGAGGKVNRATMMRGLLGNHMARVRSIQDRVGSKVGSSKTATKLPTRVSSPAVVGTHVVTVSLGSQRAKVSLVPDTGSELTWTQCQPCQDVCYNQSEQIFDPKASRSYSGIACNSTACSSLLQATANKPDCVNHTCAYTTSYSDSSFSSGDLATDRLTLTATDTVNGFIFGCGQNNNLSGRVDAGVMGLAVGANEKQPLSIVSQTYNQYRGQFSYCLTTQNGRDGHLTFGTTQNTNIKNTTMAKPPRGRPDGFYYVDLVGIKINGRQLPINTTVFSKAGTIIDSGSAITMLPLSAYNALDDAFTKFMKQKYKQTSGDEFLLNNCYDLRGNTRLAIPNISFTFGGGVEVELDSSAVMLELSDGDHSQVCLAFGANENDASNVGVFGNLQQQTLEVVFDVPGGRVGFGQKGCS